MQNFRQQILWVSGKYSEVSDSSLGRLAFHGSFSPSKTANQSLPVYEKRKFPSKTGRLLQELYKITK